MIGKYIVYQGVFRHRWSITKVVGETPNFWKVEDLRWNGESKIAKANTEIDYATKVEADALRVQKTLNEDVAALQDEMKVRREQLINRICG